MLIVTAHIPIRPEAADLFTEAATDLVRATRDEPGCLDYVVTIDPIEPTVVRMFELWENASALVAHTRTEHVAAFMKRTREPRTGKTTARIHRADTLSPDEVRTLFGH